MVTSWICFSAAMYVYCDSFYGLSARAALWSNQTGYVTVIARVARDYGNINKPRPWAVLLDSVSLLP